MAVSLLGCGGAESPFRVGELEPLQVEGNLEALHRRQPNVPLPTRPAVSASQNLGAEALYTARPELHSTDEPGAGIIKGPGLAQDGETNAVPLELSLFETIVLGLRQNRSIQSTYLNRVVDKFALYVEEETFVPKFDALTGNFEGSGGSDDPQGTGTYGTSLIWQTPYGTQLRLSSDNTETFTKRQGEEDSGTAFAFALAQPLLRGAGRDIATAQLRVARLGELQSQLALKAAVIDTITNLIAAYLDYVGQERSVDIARRELERSQQLLRSNRLQVAAGRMAANEVFQTELSVSNSELALQGALDNLDTARLALLNPLSLDPRTQIETTLKLEPQRLVVEVDRARATAYGNNPNLLAQRLQVEQQEASLLVARDDLRWQLDLQGGYGRSARGRTITGAVSGIPESDGIWSVGVRLSIPLDQLGPELALASAEIGLEQAQLSEVDARENLDTAVRDAVRSIDDGWKRYQISRRSVELAQQTLAAERAKLDAGRTTNFEVLARQATLREAEVNELSSVINYLLALARLDQQLGTTLQTWGADLNDGMAVSGEQHK